MLVTVDAERSPDGQAVKLVDLEESATALRRAIKGRDWVTIAAPDVNADMVVTLTGRRKDPSKGFVLSYVLQSGDYKSQGEYSYEGGTELMGGTRALGSDGRAPYEGRRPQSWDDQAKQFAQSLEAFAKANYERILRQRNPQPVPAAVRS